MEFYKHGSVFAMLQKAARELARSQQARRKGVSLDPLHMTHVCAALATVAAVQYTVLMQHSVSSWAAAVPRLVQLPVIGRLQNMCIAPREV
jgi:hypothetical protein